MLREDFRNDMVGYLEVGIGPDAEIFTKAPPMSSCTRIFCRPQAK